MSYTFGAATSDDITAAGIGIAAPLDNGQVLVSGWFYPTTLTAGRAYWSFGAINSLRVGTTTSELQIVIDGATTDGVLNTSGAGITTNKWWFICVLIVSENTGALNPARVWVGDEVTEPVMFTPSVGTAKVGNLTTSNVLTAGNLGASGTVAFQGDISSLFVMNTSTEGINGAFGIATSGVISSTEDVLIYQRWVNPLWVGRPSKRFFKNSSGTSNITVQYMSLDMPVTPSSCIVHNTSIGVTPVAVTVGGATYSDNRPARPVLPRNWIHLGSY